MHHFVLYWPIRLVCMWFWTQEGLLNANSTVKTIIFFACKWERLWAWCVWFAALNDIQLSLEGEVNSGGYIPRRDSVKVYIHRSSPTFWGIVVLVFTESWIKKCFFNFFWNFCETTCHFSLRSQNNEYPGIFRVMGANQNARKLLSTDLVNTNRYYFVYFPLSMTVNYYIFIFSSNVRGNPF